MSLTRFIQSPSKTLKKVGEIDRRLVEELAKRRK